MAALSVLLSLVVGAGPVAAPPAGAAGDGKVTLAGLQVISDQGDLYVSFEVEGAFTTEIRERVDSGLPVTFRYDMEVVRRRPLWFDKTLLRQEVTTTVTYDSLARQYRLARRVNDEVAETSVAVSESEMMRWMTRLDRVRLSDRSLLEGHPREAIYVRVKSLLQRRFAFFLIPSSLGTDWEKVSLIPTSESNAAAR